MIVKIVFSSAFYLGEEMPRYRPETERAKAKRLTKDYLSTPDLCKADVARKRGVSRQAITKQINRKPVQDILSEYLDSPELKKELERVAKEGLNATKLHSANIVLKKDPKTGKLKVIQNENDFVEIEDHNARHRFWHDLMISTGNLKTNGSTGGIKVITIIHAYRKDYYTSDSVRPEGGESQSGQPDPAEGT